MNTVRSISTGKIVKSAAYYDAIYKKRYHVDKDRARFCAELCTGRVLDVGCGDGVLAGYYTGSYLGVDFSRVAIELAVHRYEDKRFIVCDFVREPLPTGKWDTVVLGELLEHLSAEDEEVLFSKIQEVLSDTGHVVVTVPNGGSIPDEAHVREFDVAGIEAKLASFGSVVVHSYDSRYIVVTAHRRRPKLSVVLIVKDEEEMLPGCLDSLQAVWDELVIVDTGSKDRTVETARTSGARLGYFQWRDDFAAARNYAEALCFGEYVYWQDADEVLLKGGKRMREIVEEGKLDGISPLLIFSRDEYGKPQTTYNRQELLHKNIRPWRWEGAAHNWLVGTGRTEESSIVIEHLARPGGDRPNFKDIFDVLRKNLGDGTAERHLFYLAREHYHNKHYAETIGLVLLMLETEPVWPLQRSQAALIMGDCWRTLGKTQQAEKAYLRAMSEYDARAEPYFCLGRLCYEQQRHTEAVAWLLASTTFEPGGYFCDRSVYDWLRWDLLAVCLSKIGRLEEATDYGAIALEARPGDERLLKNQQHYEKDGCSG